MRRRFALAVAVLGLVAGAGRAEAQLVTFYTNEASFLAATSSTNLINFEGMVADDTYTSPGPGMVIGDVTFTSSYVGVSGKDAIVAGNPYNSALFLSFFGDPITANLASAGSGFTAVGGNFGNSQVTSQATLTLYSTSGNVLASQAITAGDMGLGNPATFYGFTVTGATIGGITFDSSAPFEGIDNFRFGVASVPEPASFAMLGTGVLAVLGVAWRRRRQAAA